MSSMLETLRPITRIAATLPLPLSKFHSIRLQSSRVLYHRFTPDINGNHLSFPSINPKSFNFLSSTKIRDYKILAKCQESDSTKKTNTETEPPNNPSSAPSSSSNSGSRKKREKRGKSEWWFSKEQNWKWQPLIQAQEIGVLLLQLGILMFVMRLLGPGIPLPGSEPTQPTTFVGVPYSEFLSKISSNRLQKVEVDGVHIRFKLKNEGISSQNSGDGGEVVNSKFQDSGTLLRSVTPTTKRIVYTTTRPTDIKTPYEKMLENQVEFGSPDKRSGGFLNSALLVLFYAAVLAGLLHRFPVTFSQHTAGQIRNRKLRGTRGSKASEQGETITFADVAGIDEAKEELEEIVADVYCTGISQESRQVCQTWCSSSSRCSSGGPSWDWQDSSSKGCCWGS